MKIFLSSTCYDLKDLRAELEIFLRAKDHSLLLSDRLNFPVNPSIHRHDVCIENVGQCDLYILIIDSRFGAPYYKDPSISVTWAEFREAIRTNRRIVSFVRKDVFSERDTFKKTKRLFLEELEDFEKDKAEEIANRLKPSTNNKIFDLIDEVQAHPSGIWQGFFDNSTEVKVQLDNLNIDSKHSDSVKILDIIDETDDDSNIIYFTDSVRRKPIACKSFKIAGKSYIVGFYERVTPFIGNLQHLCVLQSFANKWQTYYDQPLDESVCVVNLSDNFKILVQEQHVYFYFERLIHEMGTGSNGMGAVEFSVFDFENKSVRTLHYAGIYRNGQIDGSFSLDIFSEDENFKICNFILEQEAAKSKFIYRTSSDYNINAPDNFMEKWDVENPDFHNNESGTVCFYYYDESILFDFNEYESLEGYKSSKDHIENDYYIIFFYFGGPVLAIRKADSKQFVVIVPQGCGAGGSWGLRSIGDLKFLEDHKIFAKSMYELFEINLITGEYERKNY